MQWMSAVIYSTVSPVDKNIIAIDSQTIPKISIAPTLLSIETSLLYNLWYGGPYDLYSYIGSMHNWLQRTI
jgi:hypothetical protein